MLWAIIKKEFMHQILRSQFIFSTAISMEVLRDLSNRLAAKHVYYAMDSCYSGLGLTRGSGFSRQDVDYLEKATSSRAVQMITAGREDELAIEVNGRGSLRISS